MQVNFNSFKTPAGRIYLVAKGNKLCGIAFEKQWPELKSRYSDIVEKKSPVLRRATKQLGEYFKGKRRSFDIPYTLKGTKFQKRAWEALATIPFGKTKSYKDQAQLVRSPKAVRAIGRANGQNPLCIILPCHRVIGSNGSLTGYAGGLKIKKFLLNLERAI